MATNPSDSIRLITCLCLYQWNLIFVFKSLVRRKFRWNDFENHFIAGLILLDCVISVIKLNGTVPMKFSLRLNADDTYGMVKQQLTQRCGIPSYLLKLVQINGSNIKVTNYFEYTTVHQEIPLWQKTLAET